MNKSEKAGKLLSVKAGPETTKDPGPYLLANVALGIVGFPYCIFHLDPVYTIEFSVIKVEIFRWEILGFEVFVRNY